MCIADFSDLDAALSILEYTGSEYRCRPNYGVPRADGIRHRLTDGYRRQRTNKSETATAQHNDCNCQPQGITTMLLMFRSVLGVWTVADVLASSCSCLAIRYNRPP